MLKPRHRKNHHVELWKAIDTLAAIIALIIVAILAYFYFEIPAWTFFSKEVRNFLMTLITNFIPIYILFSISFFLFKKLQEIRTDQDINFLSQTIANEVLASLHQKNNTFIDTKGLIVSNQSTIKSRDEITAANNQLIAEAKDNIISFSGDLSWTTKCHQALIEAVKNNVSIRILCKDPLVDESKQNVARYFRQAGIEIKYYPANFDPDVRGLMIDTSTLKKAFFVEKKHRKLGDDYQRYGTISNAGEFEYWVKRLDAENDMAIVSPLAKLFEMLWKQGFKADVLSQGDRLAIEREVKKLPQYQQAKISIRSVKIANLKPLHRFIDSQEYKDIDTLASRMKKHDISLWDGVAVSSATSIKQICPPIIEIHNNESIILDGLGRVYYSRLKDEREMIACVIENVSEPLVGEPWTWDKIQIIKSSDYKKTENFQKFNATYWRDFYSVHSALEQIT